MKLRRVALIAHDNKKKDLLDWVADNRGKLEECELHATGTTGNRIEEKLNLKINKLKSGPLGGDQQIGALICEGKIDILIFFWDPLQPQPHDPDVKALLRIAVVYNVLLACNRATADFMFASPLVDQDYQRVEPDFTDYNNRIL